MEDVKRKTKKKNGYFPVNVYYVVSLLYMLYISETLSYIFYEVFNDFFSHIICKKKKKNSHAFLIKNNYTRITVESLLRKQYTYL